MHTTSPFTPQQEAILVSLARGANRTSACHAAGLPRRTLYHWIKQNPAFAGALEDAEAESIGIAEDLAYACAMRAGEDPRYLRALFFWLKHRAGWVQARPDPAPTVGAQRAALSSAAPSSPTPAPQPSPPPAPPVEATGPAALDAAHLPSGDGAAHTENPAPGVPSVPSENTHAHADQPSTRRGTRPACPPPEPTPDTTINPQSHVPSTPAPPIRHSSLVTRTSPVPSVPSRSSPNPPSTRTRTSSLVTRTSSLPSTNPQPEIPNPKSPYKPTASP